MLLKYTIGSILALPLLPLMYFQGKKIRKTVPKLPEAKGLEGLADGGSDITKNIIFLGESTIAGVGVATHEEGFCGTLAKELAQRLNFNLHWKVYAKSGYTAKDVRNKLAPIITDTPVDLIIIGLGGNDAFTLNSPSKWRQQIIYLIKDLQNKFPLTPIFFTNMPPIKEFPAFTKTIKFVIGNLVELLGEELSAMSLKRDLVYYNPEIIRIDTWSKRYNVGQNVDDFFADGVHPSKLTYQTWALDFATFISSTLTSQKLKI